MRFQEPFAGPKGPHGAVPAAGFQKMDLSSTSCSSELWCRDRNLSSSYRPQSGTGHSCRNAKHVICLTPTTVGRCWRHRNGCWEWTCGQLVDGSVRSPIGSVNNMCVIRCLCSSGPYGGLDGSLSACRGWLGIRACCTADWLRRRFRPVDLALRPLAVKFQSSCKGSSPNSSIQRRRSAWFMESRNMR